MTVRLFGAVISQTVRWDLAREGTPIGAGGAEAVPTAMGGALVTARWDGRQRVVLEPVEDSAQAGEVTLGSPWRWSNAAGVTVDLDLVPWQPARRWESQGGGDLALLALLLTLLVGVAQVNALLRLLVPPVSGTLATAEPTPEYIARLLERDLDGADEGYQERAQRPEHEREAPSFYMPAGNSGPLSRAGGGEQADREISREDPVDEADADPLDEPPVEPEEEQIQGVTEVVADAGDPLDGVQGAPDPKDAQEELLRRVRDPVERFVGWGFRDWYDVKDARAEVNEAMKRELDVVRRRLRIDPNDPNAVTTLGYYAYLAENYELGQEAFERLVKLYPDNPAGYNNLALIYKRQGEYEKEEALYRKAMEMDPFDEHVLNNLAVNLAHQARYEEALELMDLLEDIDPDDPYADLHRAKIHAAMGHKERALRYLKEALEGADALDTLHHIEFRQDIRVDPTLDSLRSDPRFGRLLERAYGADARALMAPPRDRGAGRG